MCCFTGTVPCSLSAMLLWAWLLFLFCSFSPFTDCTCLYSVAAAKPPLVDSLTQCYWGECCVCDVPPSCSWHWLCSHAGCKRMSCLMKESQNTNQKWLILRNWSLDELSFQQHLDLNVNQSALNDCYMLHTC